MRVWVDGQLSGGCVLFLTLLNSVRGGFAPRGGQLRVPLEVAVDFQWLILVQFRDSDLEFVLCQCHIDVSCSVVVSVMLCCTVSYVLLCSHFWLDVCLFILNY